MIDSRDFVAARRRAETEVHLPPGPRIAFSGGVDYQNVDRIWAALDKVHGKHPDMVLLHVVPGRRAHRSQMGRASQRRSGRVQARLDHDKQAAPFKRNDQMLEAPADRRRRRSRVRRHRQSG